MKSITATRYVKRLRGGSQSHLMQCSDGDYYVIKFQENPQHPRILVNEFIAMRLARMIGLTVPDVALVQTYEQHELCAQLGGSGHTIPYRAGVQFGSRYIEDALEYLPPEFFPDVVNLSEFAGILAFDKWMSNADGRQAMFQKAPKQKRRAFFIDFGYCFNAGEWSFPDFPMRGVFSNNAVYHSITGWHTLDPWLDKIARISSEQLWSVAADLPGEWYGHDPEALQMLVAGLFGRRHQVRQLIDDFRQSHRRPFTNWGA